MAATTVMLLLTLLLVVLSTATARIDNVVTQWNVAAQGAVRQFSISNVINARVYAILHIAQYRAFTAITQDENPEAVIAFASHYVLASQFPVLGPTFDALLKKQVGGLATPALLAAKVLAERKAESFVKRREPDGSQEWVDFRPEPPNGRPGQYQSTTTPPITYALFPQLATAEPFVIRNINKFTAKIRTVSVPSASYSSNYSAIVDLGRKESKTRSKYQTDGAFFWDDGANTHGIAGHWNAIAIEVVPPKYSLAKTVLLFARLNAAGWDASIAVWSIKYRELFWRPITAIRQGDKTHPPIPDWTPLLATPNHPEFPSGHQGVSGGMGGILERTFGEVSFTIGTEGSPPGNPIAPRPFRNFRDAANEDGLARVWGGVHFSQSTVAATMGRQIAEEVFNNFESRHSS